MAEGGWPPHPTLSSALNLRNSAHLNPTLPALPQGGECRIMYGSARDTPVDPDTRRHSAVEGWYGRYGMVRIVRTWYGLAL